MKIVKYKKTCKIIIKAGQKKKEKNYCFNVSTFVKTIAANWSHDDFGGKSASLVQMNFVKAFILYFSLSFSLNFPFSDSPMHSQYSNI